MSPLAKRIAVLSIAGLLVFLVVAALLLRLLPGPHRPADYLLAGSAATLAALAALFVAVIAGWLKARDIFYRRRRKSR